MTIFGKPLSEYVAFSKLFLGLILIVGILRLALSLGGVPNSTAKWISMTTVVWIGVLYSAIRAYTSGFGSYKHLLIIVVLLNVAAQLVAIVAIVISIFTGQDNIYSTPEYSFGQDGKTWLHAGAHLLIGVPVASIIYWLVGCVFMLITKLLNKEKGGKPARA